jgi:hypothetical protein
MTRLERSIVAGVIRLAFLPVLLVCFAFTLAGDVLGEMHLRLREWERR